MIYAQLYPWSLWFLLSIPSPLWREHTIAHLFAPRIHALQQQIRCSLADVTRSDEVMVVPISGQLVDAAGISRRQLSSCAMPSHVIVTTRLTGLSWKLGRWSSWCLVGCHCQNTWTSLQGIRRAKAQKHPGSIRTASPLLKLPHRGMWKTRVCRSNLHGTKNSMPTMFWQTLSRRVESHFPLLSQGLSFRTKKKYRQYRYGSMYYHLKGRNLEANSLKGFKVWPVPGPPLRKDLGSAYRLSIPGPSFKYDVSLENFLVPSMVKRGCRSAGAEPMAFTLTSTLPCLCRSRCARTVVAMLRTWTKRQVAEQM